MRAGKISVLLLLLGAGLLLLTGAGFLVLEFQQSSAAADAATDFAALPALVQFPAPSLELNGLDGVGHSLAEYRGQIVLVNLWATWCPPCQAEMPLLERYFQQHRADGFTVIAIEDGEPEGDVRDFVKQHALSFPVWLDPGHEATDHAFKTANLPTSYVVDRTGTVRLMWVGAISEANLDKYITPMIRER